LCTENNPTFAVSAYTLKYFPHRLTEEYKERTLNFQQCLGSEKIEWRGYILAYDDKLPNFNCWISLKKDNYICMYTENMLNGEISTKCGYLSL
jgi:hypothetical protein